MALVNPSLTADEIRLRLAMVDRSLMTIKRDATSKFGRDRHRWPADVHDEIARRKAIAIEFRSILRTRIT